MWGLLPLYLPLLKPAGPIEILAQRIMWCLVVVVAILAIRRDWAWIRALRPRRVALLALAAAFITNPLVSVVLGVLILHERLRPWQWAAIATGVIAVVVLAADYGRPPWIALTLACSFGTYGLIKKFANAGSAESLTVETTVLFVPALAYALFQSHQTFTGHGLSHIALFAGVGLVTAVPLMLFNSAATRVPLTVIGMLQYLAPMLQFLIGLLVQHEAMPTSRWIGFLLVWGALVILTADGIRAARSRRHRSATPQPVAEPV